MIVLTSNGLTSETLEEKCVNYEKQNRCSAIRLDDGDAVIISDGVQTVVRE